jgi:hypothetical protein
MVYNINNYNNMIPTGVTITRRQYKQPQQLDLVIVTFVGIKLLWLFILASSDCHFRGAQQLNPHGSDNH